MKAELQQLRTSYNTLATEINTEGKAIGEKKAELDKAHKADCPCRASDKEKYFEDCTDTDYKAGLTEIHERKAKQKVKRARLFEIQDDMNTADEIELLQEQLKTQVGAVSKSALKGKVAALLGTPRTVGLEDIGDAFGKFIEKYGHTSPEKVKSRGAWATDKLSNGKNYNIGASFFANFGKTQAQLNEARKSMAEEMDFKHDLDEAVKTAKSMFTQTPDLAGGDGELFAPTATFGGNTGGLCEFLIDNELNVLPYQEAGFLECIPVRQINKSYVLFLRQTLRINNASGVNESVVLPTSDNPTNAPVDFKVLKPESEFGFSQARAYTITFADTMAVSEEFLEDCPAVADATQTQLLQNVREELYDQIINGDGSTGAYPELIGLLAQVGLSTRVHRSTALFNGVAQPAGQATDNIRETIVNAIFDGEAYGYNMDCIIMSDTDFREMYFLKDELNHPLYTEGELVNIRGARVAKDMRMPAGTALVGAFKQVVQLLIRRQIRLDIGWVDKQFRQDMLTLRATMRAGLLVKVPHALIRITGI